MTLGMIWTIILRFAIQDISVEGKCNDMEKTRDTIYTQSHPTAALTYTHTQTHRHSIG